jgi:hypothetical protein
MGPRGSRAALLFSLVVLPSLARAEPSDQDKALATTLFNEGRSLLGEGSVAPACRKLEESQRLDPRPGTLLNVAVCHEREGLTASAWAELREARLFAVRDHRDDRVELIDQHMADLEAKLSWLVVTVAPEAADAPGLTIARDGTALGKAAWGTRIPVDPGEHVVEASAPGKRAWRSVVAVKATAETTTATVGPLEDAPPHPVAPSPLRPAFEGPPVVPPAALSFRRKVAIAAAGVGVIGLGAGALLGIRAIQKHDDPDATCTTHPCSSRSVSLNNQATFAADASTVSFLVAAAALGAGAWLWFADSTAPRGVTLVPTVSVAGGGLTARAQF